MENLLAEPSISSTKEIQKYLIGPLSSKLSNSWQSVSSSFNKMNEILIKTVSKRLIKNEINTFNLTCTVAERRYRVLNF